MKRTPVRKRRPGGPRRGRVVDNDFLEWIRRHRECAVHAESCPYWHANLTIHHVREFGSPKNDRRVLLLCPLTHLQSVSSFDSIEALGKEAWQKRHNIDIEATIKEQWAEYERQKAGK